MCIKKLIFTSIVLTFGMNSSQAADEFNDDKQLYKRNKERAALRDSTPDENPPGSRTHLADSLESSAGNISPLRTSTNNSSNIRPFLRESVFNSLNGLGVYQIPAEYGTRDSKGYGTDDDIRPNDTDDDNVIINDESSGEEVVLPSVNRRITSNPDEIYQASLSSPGKLTGDAFIFDFHGMLINEKDPAKLKPGQQLTPRGNSISNIRALIEKGAIVIICSAWNKINETVAQLLGIGFTKKDLGIVDEQAIPEFGVKKITLPKGNSIDIEYMKYGRVISTKVSFLNYGDPFYRHKAFSPFLYEGFNIDIAERIHFLDDSIYNCDEFKNNVQYYNIYPEKEVNVYDVKISSPKIPEDVIPSNLAVSSRDSSISTSEDVKSSILAIDDLYVNVVAPSLKFVSTLDPS